MGQLLNGRWVTDDVVKNLKTDGAWVRTESVVRGELDGATPGRYHLFAAWNCPWAHRVLLTRAILGLRDALPVSYVSPSRTTDGWVFDSESGYVDQLYGSDALHAVYTRGDSDYTGRVTVPLLYDTEREALVSNESADLVRMIPQAFRSFATHPLDLYPAAVRETIDDWNQLIYKMLNNGVYRAGFASTQEAYDSAVVDVFKMLDRLEEHLSVSAFVAGDVLTEADVRLFPTLARFDVAYYLAFKCCRRRLVEYPALWRYARKIYALDGVAETVNFEIYRQGYFSKSAKRNPLGIVPTAPDIDWSLPE